MMLRDGEGALDKSRSRSDQRVAEMVKIASFFPENITVITHVVHGRPEAQLLIVAQKHVRTKKLRRGSVEAYTLLRRKPISLSWERESFLGLRN